MPYTAAVTIGLPFALLWKLTNMACFKKHVAGAIGL